MILASDSIPHLFLVLATFCAYVIASTKIELLGVQIVKASVWLAWVLHTTLLYLTLLGPSPHFGFAPAISVTIWIVIAVNAIEIKIYPTLPTRQPLAAFGAIAVLIASLFPGRLVHPSASPLLALHLSLGIASYGLFGAAILHGWVLNRTEERIRKGSDIEMGMPLLTLERLTFRFVGIGFVLLSATLLAGFVFGKEIYGSSTPLHWSHKTIFSVLAWLTFASLLTGRSRLGWRGRKSIRILYIGSGMLVLAYIGSRFVLEVLLSRTL